MKHYAQAPLGEVCAVNPSARKSGCPNETAVSFVPMAAVDETTGEIAVREERPFAEVAKGYTSFEEGDVLFAKITPCMENGKVALARNLANGMGRGSTEFYVLRPGDQVLGEYIYHFVRQPRFREEAKKSFTGTAGQQRVPKSFIQNIPIPIPPLDDQRRIVAILNRAANIKRLRKQAQQRLREFIPALFVKMFGDPVDNSMGWEKKNLGMLGKLDRGRSRHRPRNARELYGGVYPFVQTGDVANSDGLVRNASQTYSKFGLSQSKLWPAGTLCITIAANIGKTGILEFDACFPDSIVGFTPNETVTVEYIQTALDLMQKRIEENAPMAAQRNINLRTLDRLKIPVPSVPLQRRFSELVNQANFLFTRTATAESRALAISSTLMANLLGATP